MIRTSFILFFVVSVIFSTIYTPQAILPTLKEVFRLGIAETNLLLSVMLFVLMVATPFYSAVSQKWEVKRIMGVSIFFLFLSVGMSAFATQYFWLVVSRVLQGIFVPGITAMMLAYVQEIYPSEHRGLGMGIYMAATGFGAVMGRLLAGWMTYLYSWRVAFGVFALLLLVALVTLVWGLPPVRKVLGKQRPAPHAMLTYLARPSILALALIPMVVFFAFMAVTTFVTYRLASEHFGLDAGALGSVFLVLLLAVVVSPVAGKLSDRYGRVYLLLSGVVSLLLGIVLTLSGTLFWVIAGIGLVTVGMFTVQSVAPAYLGDLVPEDRATMAVLYQSFFYLGGAMGTILPSIVWRDGGYQAVGLLCVGLVTVGVLPLIVNLATKTS
jgi:YNFM family putative membrane transporter